MTNGWVRRYNLPRMVVDCQPEKSRLLHPNLQNYPFFFYNKRHRKCVYVVLYRYLKCSVILYAWTKMCSKTWRKLPIAPCYWRVFRYPKSSVHCSLPKAVPVWHPYPQYISGTPNFAPFTPSGGILIGSMGLAYSLIHLHEWLIFDGFHAGKYAI